jgi:hypothetical protein
MPSRFAACAMCRRFSRGGSSPSLPSHTRSYQIIHDHWRPYTASHTTPAVAPRLAHDVGVGIGQHPGRAASPASVPALYRPPAPGHVSRREGGCWYGASPKAPRTPSQTPHPSPMVNMLRVPWPGMAWASSMIPRLWRPAYGARRATRPGMSYACFVPRVVFSVNVGVSQRAWSVPSGMSAASAPPRQGPCQR